jgi:2-dehydropantoate 2-reductase
MKILVYGAGIQGSYLAHVLVRGGNDVTMLARGKRFEELKSDGIIIQHYLQNKTTVDRVNVINTLMPEDVYDIIFVMMQYQQFQSVLPILAENQSSHIVLVGNNADPHTMQNYLESNSAIEKQVAFGFQSSGGWRENNRIVSFHVGGGSMDLGGLDGGLSWRPFIENAFKNTRYKLVFYDNIDPYLKTHIAQIMAILYATHACGGDISKVTGDKTLRNQMILAMDEGFTVLETLGYTITPPTLSNLIRKRRPLVSLLLRFGSKIFLLMPSLNKMVDPMEKPDESIALSNAFDDLKQRANIPTPNLDALKNRFQTSK